MTQLLTLDPQPGLRLDADGSVIEANAALLELRDGDYPGALEALLPGNVKALVRAALKQSRAIDGVQNRTRDRVLEWLFIPDTTSNEVFARARETTRETALLDEATRASRLYRLIIENTTDLISRHAPCGRFIDASPASARLLGYRPDELRDQPAALLMDFDSASISPKELSHQLVESGYATFTIRLKCKDTQKCKDGQKRWVEVASRAIRETYTGEIIEVIAVTRDITERKLREAEQRRHEEELAHTTRLATLGELASGIAHEMNQPLASITNYANASQRYLQRLTADHPAHERIAQGLEHIQSQADHAARVIKRLRAFLRKTTHTGENADLHSLIGKAIKLCEWQAEEAEVTIEQPSSPANPTVRGDPVLLEQVLINLLRNAIDANREHNPTTPSRIRVTTRETATNMVEIAIEDQGPGLDEEGIEHMFTPFFTRKTDGLGLGLSMSRSIVDGFGGYLDATPGPEGGLRLVCRLPHAHTKGVNRTARDD